MTLALFLGVTAVLAPAASAQYPPTTGTATVSASAIVAGGCVTFTGTGFEPGSPVTITDNGGTVTTATADSSGNVSATVCPTGLGEHVLSASGVNPVGTPHAVTAEVTVVAAAQPGLPFTGAAGTLPAAALGAGLLALGAVLVVAVRRRRTAPQFS